MSARLAALWRARASIALVLLRLVVGFGFAAHGLAKLTKGPEHFADLLSTMGVPLPWVTAWLTTVVELAGGVALMLGLAVQPLAGPLAIVMLTAMAGVHWRYGFSSVRLVALSASGARFGPVGYEINLLYVGALAVLATAGPGPASVDGWLARRRSARAPR